MGFEWPRSWRNREILSDIPNILHCFPSTISQFINSGDEEVEKVKRYALEGRGAKQSLCHFDRAGKTKTGVRDRQDLRGHDSR